MAVSADEINAHFRSLIAAYKVPSSVTLRSEAMPANGAGKSSRPT
jgi:acyl-CoA synthetase (AMP-forming)/AMP-acid ligase II